MHVLSKQHQAAASVSIVQPPKWHEVHDPLRCKHALPEAGRQNAPGFVVVPWSSAYVQLKFRRYVEVQFVTYAASCCLWLQVVRMSLRKHTAPDVSAFSKQWGWRTRSGMGQD